MKNLAVQRRNSFKENNRKVPLNTIILPPLSPPLPEKGPQLIGRVLVNKSKTGELVSVTRSPEMSSRNLESPKGPDGARVAQLEQNIRFLQEQHQIMLSGLHNEIESLRNRNRELQFQLVFVKGTLPSSPSSPEDDVKPKVYTSPKQINITPLQVEILEKELGELKLQMQEVESRNVYLSAIVDEQKKKLERYERDREKERERALQPDPELLRKLDDAEAIIRRLRRENSDLRRENSISVAAHFQLRDTQSQQQQQQQHHHHQHHHQSQQSPSNGGGGSGGGYKDSPRGGQRTGGNNGGGRHRGNNSAHYNGRGGGGGGNNGGGGGGNSTNWFPPLHTQNYWQGSRTERNSTNGVGGIEGTLPNIPHNGGGHSSQYQGRRGSNNNHYHNGDGRKYRGGQNKSTKPS